MCKYIIITPAYNEEKNIEKTLSSVVRQSLLPFQWVIISDGSTDGTDDIIKKYQMEFDFITFLRIDREKKHSFGAKVHAINYGYERVKDNDYDFIGILDADVSFDAGYFQKLINRFHENPKLGIGGGNIVQYIDGQYEARKKDINTVAGAVQFFRRECFEISGGFIPIEYGGEDAAVEFIARMNGWIVQTFADLEVIHYGFVGRGSGTRLKARFKWGKMNYVLGYHPLYECIRCIYRASEKPFLLGSFYELIGFFSAWIKKEAKQLPPEVISFLRKEQLYKIFSLLRIAK